MWPDSVSVLKLGKRAFIYGSNWNCGKEIKSNETLCIPEKRNYLINLIISKLSIVLAFFGGFVLYVNPKTLIYFPPITGFLTQVSSNCRMPHSQNQATSWIISHKANLLGESHDLYTKEQR